MPHAELCHLVLSPPSVSCALSAAVAMLFDGADLFGEADLVFVVPSLACVASAEQAAIRLACALFACCRILSRLSH